MTSKYSMIIFALIIAAALVFAFLPSKPDLTDTTASVVSVSGSVVRIDADGQPLGALGVGELVNIRDGVSTGARSFATLEFADGSQLLIASDSRVYLETLKHSTSSEDVETVISLASGQIESRVTKRAGVKAHYRVVTPALQLGVRGTVFLVNVDKDSGRTVASVLEGVVDASGGDTTIELSAGFGTSALPGEKPSAPQPLPDSPSVDVANAVFTLVDTPVAWDAVNGADAYRVKVYTDGRKVLLRDDIVASPTYVLDNLDDGRYQTEISALTKSNLESRATAISYTMDAHPLAPVPQFPLDDAVVETRKTKFSWEPSAAAQFYRVQVADTVAFETLVSEVPRLPSAMQELSVRLKAGDYYWRLASIAPDGEQGPFSEVRSFKVR